MKKYTLNELREIAIMCLAISQYNRAVDYKSVMKIIRLGNEIEGLIKHQIGDKLEKCIQETLAITASD